MRSLEVILGFSPGLPDVDLAVRPEFDDLLGAVRPVAEGPVGGLLAVAEPDFLVLGGDVADGAGAAGQLGDVPGDEKGHGDERGHGVTVESLRGHRFKWVRSQKGWVLERPHEHHM